MLDSLEETAVLFEAILVAFSVLPLKDNERNR